METTPPLDESPLDELDEQLVAYLDGELEDEERRALENRLMDDVDCKNRLASLQQSFDMLDQLPKTSVNQDFAHTTVEMVALTASQELEVVKSRQPWKYAKLFGSVAIASLIAFLGGTAAIRSHQQRQRNIELEGLAVAENFRAYSLIKSNEDIDFFSALAKDPSWQDGISLKHELGELPTRDIGARLSLVALKDRPEHLVNLTPNARTQLQLENERFVNQNADRQAELRSYCKQIEALVDADQVLAAMANYVDWTDSLPESKRKEVQAAKGSNRLNVVVKVMDDVRHGFDKETELAIKKVYDDGINLAQSLMPEFTKSFPSADLAKLDKSLRESMGNEASFDQAKAHWVLKNLMLVPIVFHLSRPEADNFDEFDSGARLNWMQTPEKQRLRQFFNEVAALLDQAKGDQKQYEHLRRRLIMEVVQRTPQDLSAKDPTKEYLSANEEHRQFYDLQDPDQTLRDLRDTRRWRGRGFGGGYGRGGFGPPGGGGGSGPGRGGPGRGGPGRGPGDKQNPPDKTPKSARSGPSESSGRLAE